MRKTIFIFSVIVWCLNLRSQSTSGTGAVSFNASGGELIGQFYGHRDFLQQFEIAKKIAELHDPRLLPQLVPLLTDEDRHVRGNAAFVFAASGDEHGFDVIYSILKDRTSDRPEGQGVPGGNWSVRAQVRSDRYYAAHLLGDLKDSRVLPTLIPLLRDEDVSWIVPWALGQIGDPNAIPPLLELLADPSPDLRVLSIYALEKLKAKEALPRLKALTQDGETIHFDGLGTVGEAATAAIAKLNSMQ
jgi:HEAT repeat protein